MLFCAFGRFPKPLCFIPLALTSSPLAFTVAFPSHSPCIPLAFGSHYPLASPLHSAFIPCTTLGVSGCRGVGSARGVGVSGRLGCRGVGSVARLSLSLPPSPSPKYFPLPPPPVPLPCPEGENICGCSFGKLQPLLSPQTSAVGLL